MRPLFILPFDHRSSFARDLLGASYPVSSSDKEKLITYKKVIFEGLLYAKERYSGNGEIATIIDEEFGMPVIRKAQELGVPFALTTEGTRHDTFEFVHGDGFRVPLQELNPAFAKALVYYKVGDEEVNAVMRSKLRELSEYCAQANLPFMLEVLIQNYGRKSAFTGTMIDEMQASGVIPHVWKIEALETEEEWHELATHTAAPMIILGRGESKEQVDAWVTTAARSGKTIGFAVGRTIFLAPLVDFASGTSTRTATVAAIGENFLHYINLWEKEAR